MSKKEISFEKAFERLEEILEKMNSGEAGLEESLQLYEESDSLIAICSKRLNLAEQKVKKLIKERGELVLDDEGIPLSEDFRGDARDE